MDQTLADFREVLGEAEPANGMILYDYLFMMHNCPVSQIQEYEIMVKDIVSTVKVGEVEHIVVYCKSIEDVFN